MDCYLTWVGNPEPIRLFQHSCPCICSSLISGTCRIRRKPACRCDDGTNNPRNGNSEDDLRRIKGKWNIKISFMTNSLGNRCTRALRIHKQTYTLLSAEPGENPPGNIWKQYTVQYTSLSLLCTLARELWRCPWAERKLSPRWLS